MLSSMLTRGMIVEYQEHLVNYIFTSNISYI